MNSLVWLFALQILEQGRILSLSAAHVLDSGMYTCVAVNSAGEDSQDTELQVYGKYTRLVPCLVCLKNKGSTGLTAKRTKVK